MKIVKTFDNKKILIRSIDKKDLRSSNKFQEHINSLIAEDAQILLCQKVSLKEEISWLKNSIGDIDKKKAVFVIAEYNNRIIAVSEVSLRKGLQSHVGEFGISVRSGFRGIGLGKFLMGEVIKLSKKQLKIKSIRLSVFSTNKPAISLYKKYGFKQVAKIPKQLRHKGKLVDEIIMLLV